VNILLHFTVEDEKAATGSSNLLVEHGMEHAYQKFFGKKTKESLSSFLTHLPGLIDVPGTPNDG
jgi:mediator of RNA polymerase II transcription subunit 19